MTAGQRAATQRSFLIDGSIYFFRGYFGMPDTLVDDTGEPCGGLHGFARALVAVLGRHPGQNGAVAFDESLGSCFRNELYPDYKANRAPPDDNIIYQFEQSRRLCELLGVPAWASTRFEADDLLATLAHRARKQVTIYSKDKDLRQLVSAKCELRDVLSDDGFDAPGFAATYGFEPGLFPDYQALVGDTSDNVPGVPGIGPKSAVKLVARYGALEAIFASVDRFTDDKVGVPTGGKVAASLQAHADQALRMRTLLRLRRDAPLAVGATQRSAVQQSALRAFLAAKRLGRHVRGLQDIGLLAASD